MESAIDLVPDAAPDQFVERRPQPGNDVRGKVAGGMRIEQGPEQRRSGVLWLLDQPAPSEVQPLAECVPICRRPCTRNGSGAFRGKLPGFLAEAICLGGVGVGDGLKQRGERGIGLVSLDGHGAVGQERQSVVGQEDQQRRSRRAG